MPLSVELTAKESESMDTVLVSSNKSVESKFFESLWQDDELADVTLVCRDGSQLRAHKTVLALSSRLLRTILTRSKKSDPVLLLLSTDALVLERLLRLVYFGEERTENPELEVNRCLQMYFCISWQYFCISTVFLFFYLVSR